MIADMLEAKNAKEVIKAKRQENICLRYQGDQSETSVWCGNKHRVVVKLLLIVIIIITFILKAGQTR